MGMKEGVFWFANAFEKYTRSNKFSYMFHQIYIDKGKQICSYFVRAIYLDVIFCKELPPPEKKITLDSYTFLAYIQDSNGCLIVLEGFCLICLEGKITHTLEINIYMFPSGRLFICKMKQ